MHVVNHLQISAKIITSSFNVGIFPCEHRQALGNRCRARTKEAIIAS